jgi:hypothetical protein
MAVTGAGSSVRRDEPMNVAVRKIAAAHLSRATSGELLRRRQRAALLVHAGTAVVTVTLALPEPGRSSASRFDRRHPVRAKPNISVRIDRTLPAPPTALRRLARPG